MKPTIFIILSLGVALSSQFVLQNQICPEFDWMEQSTTIEDLIRNHLKKNGPADGVCETMDKWIFHGEAFGLQSGCACLNIPTKPEIKPGQGKKCTDWKNVNPSDTALQSWKRNYDDHPNAPSDGWCPEDQIKWVVFGTLIGVPNDTCFCIKDYGFNSPHVSRLTVPIFDLGHLLRLKLKWHP